MSIENKSQWLAKVIQNKISTVPHYLCSPNLYLCNTALPLMIVSSKMMFLFVTDSFGALISTLYEPILVCRKDSK